jgi:hypothetical protein
MPGSAGGCCRWLSDQESLDQLLPKIGPDMVRFIRERTGTAEAARQEIERL